MLEKCLSILGLKENYTEEELEVAYAEKKKNIGDSVILNDAYKELKQILDHKKEVDRIIKKIKDNVSCEFKISSEEFLAIYATTEYIYEASHRVSEERIEKLKTLPREDVKVKARELGADVENSIFDYENDPKATLESWTVFSELMDTLDYLHTENPRSLVSYSKRGFAKLRRKRKK